MSAVISISVQVPEVQSALYLLRLAHEEIDSNEDMSIVGVHITDQTQPPF